jgi:hypothetical protein
MSSINQQQSLPADDLSKTSDASGYVDSDSDDDVPLKAPAPAEQACQDDKTNDHLSCSEEDASSSNSEESESEEDEDTDLSSDDSHDDHSSERLDASPDLSAPAALNEVDASDLFFRTRKAGRACAKLMSRVSEIYQKEDVSDATIPDDFNPEDIPEFEPSGDSESSSATKRKFKKMLEDSADSTTDGQDVEAKRAKLFEDACNGAPTYTVWNHPAHPQELCVEQES